MRKRKSNLETISLAKLSAIQQSQGEKVYEKLVNEIFCSRDNLFARYRLSLKWPLNLENEERMNAEAIHSTKVVIKGECFKKDVLDDMYNRKKDEFNKKNDEYIKIQKEIAQIQEEIDKMQLKISHHQNSLNMLYNELANLENISEELKRVVLVHNTASVNQFKKYQHRKIVIIPSDIPYLKPIGVFDEVFSGDCKIIDLPYDMLNRKLNAKEQSAVDFVNMMIYYKINNDVEFDAIYSDEIISKLLKFNHYDELN